MQDAIMTKSGLQSKMTAIYEDNFDYSREWERFMLSRASFGGRTIDDSREWLRFMKKPLIILGTGDDSRDLGHCDEM